MEKKAVADLRSHPNCQARLGLTEEAVKSYTAAYKAGKALPPLEVFEVEGELIVVDGFHRLEAAQRAEVATLPVEVIGSGTIGEAEWEALGKNHHHGVRRTREDKRKAVHFALRNPAAAKLSNRKLGKYLDVSHTFVANERKMLEVLGDLGSSPEVEFAWKLLGTDEGKAMLVHCRTNAANCERTGGGWISRDGEEDYRGPLTVSRRAQWIRLKLNLNRARYRAELNGVWWHTHLNLTHVAGLVARAADCEPGEGFWKSIAEGWSLDRAIVYDDTRPDPFNHDDLLDELQQLAPHRKVTRMSKGSERSRDHHRRERELAFPIRSFRDDEQ